ncbi:hypothetical protein VP01_4g17 [Puccinia sorghi]|uniref:DDE Tnp4 domain-containing protein n=1 Tax=Puccinia sorghi TaxID=27349 RepID=A0A0L6ULQ9_9BASI|nr:hypothetical protein VP01_4g17 [Puccinia sorghi]
MDFQKSKSTLFKTCLFFTNKLLDPIDEEINFLIIDWFLIVDWLYLIRPNLKVPGSFCCYSNHAPKLIQPSCDSKKFYIGKHVEFGWKLGWRMLHVNCMQLHFSQKTKANQTCWKINSPFENTNTRNNTLQPRAPPLIFTHNTISPCFLNLLLLIEPDPIFYNQPLNPQQDFSIQAVATSRLGSNGNGAAALRLKNLLQVEHRTINLYTMQVIKVMQEEGFLAVLGVWIKEILKQFLTNFLIPFIPMYSKTCRLISSLKNSLKNQFLLAESANTSDKYTLPANKGKELIDHWNVYFNYHFAQSRVRIKHAIGILKGQFSSLCEMQTQIRNQKEMKMSLIPPLWLLPTFKTQMMGSMES